MIEKNGFPYFFWSLGMKNIGFPKEILFFSGALESQSRLWYVYPRVTKEVFAALSHGGQSYFKGILKGAVPRA